MLIILSSIIVQIAIIFGVVTIFIVTFILNRRTKAPKHDMPEKCQHCPQQNCLMRTNKLTEAQNDFDECLKGDDHEKQ